MSTAVIDPPATSEARPLLTKVQLGWLAFQLVILATVAVGASMQNKDFSLLWKDAAGQKMLLWAGIYLLGNVALFVGGCVVGNRWIGSRLWRNVLVVALAVAGSVFLYLPVLFVLLLGPAALAVQRQLAQ